MPQPPVLYRHVGIRGPGDNALKSIIFANGLGVGRFWRTSQPAGLHIVRKRWWISGRLVVHSYFWSTKRPSGRYATVGTPPPPTRRHYKTEIPSLTQPVDHAGVRFTLGRLAR